MLTGAIVTAFFICFFFGNVRADNSCIAGWFGNYCQYKCRCKNSTCDTNGDCVGTMPCERGWFGYKCQYQDLSSLADTSQPRLIDGDDSTCNEDLNVTSVSFNLKTPFLFSWMRLVFRLKGRNVAIRQPTQQSSIYKDINGLFTGSENAVDGNADRNWENGSCTHTENGDLYQTWSVKLNTSFVVNRFVLHNRDSTSPLTSYVPRRLQHFILLAFNETQHPEMQYQDQEPQVLQVYTVNEYIKNPISKVNISTYNKNDNFLTLCEVEIYGDCPDGKFGLDCNQTCDAKCGHRCNMDIGSCNYICLGFSNPPVCNKTCDQGKWGISCNNNCSQNCLDSNCDRETGLCVSGCKGFSDPLNCTKGCNCAFWGVNCTSTCNELCKNSSCNKVTGQCNNGCSAGYQGLRCNEECFKGQWRDNCSNNCSSNCWGEVCNKQSGLCNSGCNGFSNPPDCTQGCPDGSWGLNCHSKCSTQCINQICHSVTGHCMFNCTEGCNYLTYSE
ncbi:hypothetical protein BgiMline_014612, partial [Biomphalaria glabrata]